MSVWLAIATTARMMSAMKARQAAEDLKLLKAFAVVLEGDDGLTSGCAALMKREQMQVT